MNINRRLLGSRAIGFFFLAPVLALILLCSYIPFVWNLVLSLQEWDGFQSRVWVGLQNYLHIFDDSTTMQAFYHSSYLCVFITLFSVSIGIFLATCIYPLGQKEGALFRLTLFIPYMVPASIIAIMFSFIYSPVGILNQALQSIGLESWKHVWLGESATLLPSIGLVEVYRSMGITMMLCFTAMQFIPKALFEASRMEGIGYFRQFTLIILPLIKPIIQLCVVLTLISSFQTFGTVKILTGGGPGGMSKTVSFQMIDTAFSYNEFGYSASMGALFTGIMFVAVLIVRRILRGEAYEY